jgi:hypothetical protein
MKESTNDSRSVNRLRAAPLRSFPFSDLDPASRVAHTSRGTGQFLLGPERQRTLDGREEPLTAQAVEVEPTRAQVPDSAQAALFGEAQLPLPLSGIHALEDGKAAKACTRGRGFSQSVCPKHPGERKGGSTPNVCGVQSCISSRDANGRERARDAWNGTADDGERFGLRDFGDVPWFVFVFTLPAELRPWCVGKRQLAFRKAAGEMTFEVLRRHGGGEGRLYAKSWFHPVGDAENEMGIDGGESDGDGKTFKPHENVLGPLVIERDGRAIPLKFKLPASAFGADGWVGKRWRERLVGIFGEWWGREEPPNLNWHYQWKHTPEEKAHALGYFGRVFSQWVGVEGVSVRPRSIGAAHWTQKDALRLMVARFEPLPQFGACARSTVEAPCPDVMKIGGTEERVAEVVAELVAERNQERWAAFVGRPLSRQMANHQLRASIWAGDSPPTGPPVSVSTLPDAVPSQLN